MGPIRVYTKIRLASVVLMCVAVAACGSATSPSPQSSALRATYVDSVMRANCVGAGNAACDLTREVMVAMSEGAVPSRIYVQTISGFARWWAIVVASYQPVGQQGRVDTTESIVAYPDTTFTSGVIIHVYADSGPGFGGGSTYVGDRYIGGADVSGSTAVARVTTQCVPVTGISSVPPFPVSKCHYAQFAISFNLAVGGFAGTAVDQTINGVIAGPL
jgi:hypothetical protein